MTDQKNNIGFFKHNNSHLPNLNYQPDIPFQKTDTHPQSKPNSPSISATKTTSKDVRKTIRIPEQQYFELNALLELSGNKYMYELLAELVNDQIKQLSKNNPDTLRAYQEIIERLKMTAQRKK